MTSPADTGPTADEISQIEDDAVRICQELIRFESTNFGDGRGPGERAAAEYVVGLLQEVGLDPVLVESEKGRANVVVRTEGLDPGRDGIVLHGHLDVVPANADDWEADPFAGEIRDDGCIWGRGAVDMLDMDAMLLANLRHVARSGAKPPRDIVWAFFADEEAGGTKGSHWVVDNHPTFFEGCSEAISEVGGFSVTLPRPDGTEQRAYLVQTAEKGYAWIRLRAHGRAGHGSVPNDENAIGRLAHAIARIDAHPWPREYVASVRDLLDGVSRITGVTWADDDCSDLLRHLGGARGFVEGTLRDTAQFTILEAGYKHNVIPQSASAALDCRFLPGHQESLLATIRELAGEYVEVEIDDLGIALEQPFHGPLVDRMKAALLAEDPGADVLPYCLSGGTDNKALLKLGVRGYGFAPLRLPQELDFVGMFHGINERVPVESLKFGTRVLSRFIASC